MGLGPAAVRLTLELKQRGLLRDVKAVAEIGSQEIHVTEADFERLLQSAGVDGYRRDRFPGIENYPGQPRSSARPFYELLGAVRYVALDINGDFGAIRHDLNEPFSDRAHFGQYDLVTDHGSCEHAFNVAECYRTLHRLCRPGGLIVVMQQVFGGNGYYTFDVPFFEGLAAANGYRILFSSYVITTPDRNRNQFHVPAGSAILGVIDWSSASHLGIAYVFQKIDDADFRIPYEGPLLSAAHGHNGYRLQFLPDPPARTYVPLFTLDHVRTRTLLSTLAARVRHRLLGS